MTIDAYKNRIEFFGVLYKKLLCSFIIEPMYIVMAFVTWWTGALGNFDIYGQEYCIKAPVDEWMLGCWGVVAIDMGTNCLATIDSTLLSKDWDSAVVAGIPEG